MPTVSGTVTDRSGNVATWSTSWTVGTTPPPAEPIIGMSAPKAEWSARVSEVGTVGLKARRIFGDLASGPQSQSDLIEAAIAAGQMPVISYKTGPTPTPPSSMDATAAQAAAYLNSLGVPVTVTIWHEPNSDMTGAQFCALQRRFVPRFKGVGKIKVGPFINGFLLTQPSQPAGVNEFTTFTKDAQGSLLDLWDWFGIDAYQSGTITAPGPTTSADKFNAMIDWLGTQGHPDMPVGIGEYNGFSGQVIAEMGEAMLSTPNTFFGCVWNVDEARAGILTGDRLAAFKATKADPRAQQ